MIGYLKGKIIDRNIEKSDCRAVLLVNDVGYEVQLPASGDYQTLGVGSMAEFHIYTHVREDALVLFGFRNPLEKELFLTLLSVSGIGPRGAMSLISGLPHHSLLTAIATGDTPALTRIPGIGKKTAERIVLELGDRLAKRLLRADQTSIILDHSSRSQTPEIAEAPNAYFRIIEDARSALMGLGFKEAEASELLKQAEREIGAGPSDSASILKLALKKRASTLDVTRG